MGRYASGGIIVSLANILSYWDLHVLERQSSSKLDSLLLIINIILYGLMILGVAIEYPSGGIVVVSLGSCIILGLLYQIFARSHQTVSGIQKRLSIRQVFGSTSVPVVQYYLGSWMLGVLGSVVWMAATGARRRSEVFDVA